MDKLDQLFGLLRFAANDQLLVHVGTRGMPGALEKTDLRPNLDPWVHRDGVATAAAPCTSWHQPNNAWIEYCPWRQNFGSRSNLNPNLLCARLLRRELSAIILREEPIEMQQFR